MTFRNELFLLDSQRPGWRWDKGETSAKDDRVTMVGSTGFWCVFPPVAEFSEEKRPVLRDLDGIIMTHREVRYQIENPKHSDPSYDVNKWDFVYDFDIKGLGEIVVALAGDMKGPDRGVNATQTESTDPTIITDRFGNRFRYESHAPQKGGGHFYLVRQVDAAGKVIARPESIPAQTDILPIIKHVMRCVHGSDADPANDNEHTTLPTKYTLGPMLLGSEVVGQTRGYITMGRSVDIKCVPKP